MSHIYYLFVCNYIFYRYRYCILYIIFKFILALQKLFEFSYVERNKYKVRIYLNHYFLLFFKNYVIQKIIVVIMAYKKEFNKLSSLFKGHLVLRLSKQTILISPEFPAHENINIMTIYSLVLVPFISCSQAFRF